MIYLDTSSLLKLLVAEPESPAVQMAVQLESDAVVSPLSELEILVQLRAMWLGGELSIQQRNQVLARFQAMREEEPFLFPQIPGTIFPTALRQHQAAGRVHCRGFDRLHLAAMEELAIRRLMTNDGSQAAAAKALGFEVIVPG
ncbi:MAG: Ribonuclease VapC [Pedosphaera sp.]|nr:Ribonuclease VapC [Pedosphaera sp.]